ncbi:MAG: LuxR C-terminal-related transcriptional regulator [Actinomycetes bacterium]
MEPRLVTLPHLTTSDVLAASPGDRTPRPQQRLTVPIPAAPTVCRERVLRLLEEAVRRPVTLVTGGAGCGKTVAVSDWASHHRAAEATVWVSLTRLEADAGGLWAAIRESARAVLGDAAGAAGVGAADGLEEGLDLLGCLGRRGAVLVLDDLHLVEAGDALPLMEAVLRRPPAGLRLVLICRHPPRLALHRLRVAGELSEIGWSDLAFSAPEAGALFATAGVALPDALVGLLVQATGGWASGLRLASLALASAPDPSAAAASFDGANPLVTEYLSQELAAMDADRRQLLLSLSAVDEVSAPLAEALSGNPDAASILADLEAEDYVTAVRPGWYRHRPLVRQVTRSRPRAPEAPTHAELCKRAAAWYEAQDELVLALDYAVRSEDWGLAGGIALRAVVSAAVHGEERGPADWLSRTLDRVPERAMLRCPELLVARAWARFDSGDAVRGSAALRDAAHVLALRPPEMTFVSVAEAALEALLAHRRGDAAAMLAHAARAEAALTALSPTEVTEWFALRRSVARLVAVGELWMARPGGVLDLVRREGARADAPALAALTGIRWQGHIALAELAIGLVQQSKRTALAALGAATDALQDAAGSAPAWLTLTVVCLREGDTAAAEEAAARGAAANGGADVFVSAAFPLASARRCLALGDLHGARAWLADATIVGGTRPAIPWLAGIRTAVAIEVELAAGLPSRAAGILAAREAEVSKDASALDPDTLALPRARMQLALHREAEVRDTVAALLGASGHLRAEAWLLLSYAEDALRRDSLATEAFSHALDQAAAEGVLQSFLLPHPRLEAMLRRHGDVVGTHRGFIDRVLAATGAERLAVDVTEVDPLTERELSVLAYLPTLSSNSEIAGALSISVNTVKQHLKSIHRKLQVSTRRDAVRVARRLDLLPRASD